MPLTFNVVLESYRSADSLRRYIRILKYAFSFGADVENSGPSFAA